MAEGMRALALNGFTRLSTTGDSTSITSGDNIRSSTQLTLGRLKRQHDFLGQPFWVDYRTRQWFFDHPSGYWRDLRFVRSRDGSPEYKGYWLWFDYKGRFVADDIRNCFLS